MTQRFLLIVIFASVGISQLSLFFLPELGLLTNGIILFLMLFLAIYDTFDTYAKDTLALATVLPLLTLAGILLNTPDIFLRVYLIYLLLLGISVFYVQRLYIIRKVVKFNNPNSIIQGIVLGLGLGILGVFFAHNIHMGFRVPFVFSLLLVFAISCAEEMYFRLLLQNATGLLTNSIYALVTTAFFYILFHATAHLAALFFYTLLGIILSLSYLYWKNIYSTFLINFTTNLTFLIFTGSVLPLLLR